jgi:PAS domain S-box-containing protein
MSGISQGMSQSFEQELEVLRERLQEAEEMRRAISHGEVDAFVVGPGTNARVLLLANAYQRYRQLVERMQQGAITATPDGHILFANERFADMLAIPISQLYTAPLESYVGVGNRAELSRFLMLSERDSQVDVELNRRDGTSIPVRFSVASFTDGYATLLATDLRPMQWPSLAVKALDSIRDSLEKLDPGVAGEIREQLSRLARIIEEMRDVESPDKGKP